MATAKQARRQRKRQGREHHDMTLVWVRCLACGLEQRNREGGCRRCGHSYAEYAPG